MTRKVSAPRLCTTHASVVGLALTRARKRVGMTLVTLGEHVGLSQALLSRVERGQVSVSLAHFVAIAEVCQTTGSALLESVETMSAALARHGIEVLDVGVSEAPNGALLIVAKDIPALSADGGAE